MEGKDSNNCGGSNGISASSQHRFFFINEILCRTETVDATFRPSDVFVGLDPPSVGTSMLHNVSPESANATVESKDDAVIRDCPILGTFGVLSGGVLVDPNLTSFVDFTDDMIIAPSISDKENRNNTHYGSFAYSEIRGEGVLTLLSSIEPFNTLGTKRTPLSWPKSIPTLFSSIDAHRLSRRNVHYIMNRCVSGIPLKQEAFTLLEEFRCRIKSVSSMKRSVSGYIPFYFQHGGKKYSLKNATGNNLNSENQTPAHVYSAASPWSGFYSLGYYTQKVFRIHWFSFGDLRTQIQRLVEPLRRNLSIKGKQLPLSAESDLKHSWCVFLRFFAILRAHPSSTPNVEGRTVWQFVDDSDLNYLEAVREYREARLNRKCRPVKMTVVVDAWDWLLKHDRHQLMRRISKIKKCIRKLNSRGDIIV